ncbi:hypothetical protein [Cryocola sp. 340MFSha3.1]|uniref:hypothetical protein n=1 Tax=Cryocola sp. 340MFSha3.1 TaxID=1169145 RepID=UPI000363D6E5|nr:hypothetical protein [Cryocola sp. 340MFSha3.1]
MNHDVPTFGRARERRRRWRIAALVAASIIGGILFFQLSLAYDSGYPSTTVTGKHHTPASTDCRGSECSTVPASWQLDILSGRQANTITVDKATYDHYDIGDAYED